MTSTTAEGQRSRPATGTEYIRAGWDLTPDLNIYIEAVHRLNNFGAVFTHRGHGTSQEGFDAEWRAIDILMVDGELITRCEVFDETDLDAALAKFDQLSRPAPRLENAASQAPERYLGALRGPRLGCAREVLADDICTDDRRRAVNAGSPARSRCRDREHAAVADIGNENMTSDVIAARGERLVLTRRASGRDRAARGVRHRVAQHRRDQR